jgi:hypothetical protein
MRARQARPEKAGSSRVPAFRQAKPRLGMTGEKVASRVGSHAKAYATGGDGYGPHG